MVEAIYPQEIKWNTKLVTLFSMVILSLISPGCDHSPWVAMPTRQVSVAYRDSLLIRGINLGGALEAPSPGEWGVTIQPHFFNTIHDAGLNAVRIPVRFSAHTSPSPPYIIEPDFLQIVDKMIEQGLNSGLTIILDLHHFEELMANPTNHRERFLAIWAQLAEHYQNYPSHLNFEILNEPTDNLDADTWNMLIMDCINIIRQSNPERKVLIGGVNYNNIESLNLLQLPADENLIAVFHFYEPFEFTHQGASWVNNANKWIGNMWEGSTTEKEEIKQKLDLAADWSASQQIPLLMGEFGTIKTADEGSRQRWTEFIVREAEERNIGWIYWDFCGEFAVYNCQQDAWNDTLIQALIQQP